MAYAEKLFVPFQRLHPVSQFEGTGIGLATVRRVIRRHGGQIWGTGTPGEGATFTFTLSTQASEPGRSDA
jgi:light-regulated signal transduction histidine kinase (bacteriophytochrome)